MQQAFDFTAAVANPSPPAIAIVCDHLAQRGFWTYRGFRLAVDAALERNGIAHIAFSAALGEPKDLVSRCIAGRSKSSVFRVAEALGYTSDGGEEIDAVFKLKQKEAA